ncbi:hypothetical protein VNO77_33607 [Canavalia gladiata]|uniref:Uncharacterized protein n=1 Tax=Canavalia gladiata TaxID=3824 RepID=A0AAN9KCQ0_CANGL
MWWPFSRNEGSEFSSSSTAEQVTHDIHGGDLTAIVTGASSGIGAETTRVLAMRGVHVIMAVRNLIAAEDVKQAIFKEIPTAKVDAMELDLSSMASVRKFASQFNASDLPLNILINNAGIYGPPFTLSEDNIELQFATNHLGHFLLTNLLLDTMKKTARESKKQGRIVNVSSHGHRLAYRQGILFDKLNDQSSYRTIWAYGQSKLANILHANELARHLKFLRGSRTRSKPIVLVMKVVTSPKKLNERWDRSNCLDWGSGLYYWGYVNWALSLAQNKGVDITANSLHPGVIATNILRYSGVITAITPFSFPPSKVKMEYLKERGNIQHHSIRMAPPFYDRTDSAFHLMDRPKLLQFE